ncbi:MAG: YggT family protein [Chloroflexi bacterium]|nr:YggT family protein [Chloroflexota bacterium]
MNDIFEPIDRREEVRVSQGAGVERQARVVEDVLAKRRLILGRIIQLVWLMASTLEALIALRFVLKLIAANPDNTFARLVYDLTAVFLWPFFGLTITPSVEGIVLEIHSLIAMVVYALLAWFVVQLIWLIFYRTSARTVTVVERLRR